MEKTNVLLDAQDLTFKISADLDKVRTVVELLGSSAYLSCNVLDEKNMIHLRYNHPNNANLFVIICDYLFEMNNNVNEVMTKLSVLKDEIRTGEKNEDNNDY
ncbi:hypothetical protein [Butyrivibrio sp. AE3004]|uniref:hypothetical protein n=1 Tax=Butyrivibrio sp. AE3004 TaxID=1506994 RepID=UPI000493B93A|nr:hypothetical protein [Butyrivibrio sp. AE3004]